MSNLIFDLDGVIITYEKNFAQKYSEEFGVDIAEIYKFFSNDYHDCAIGQGNLIEKIGKYVQHWQWPGDAQSLVKYWFDCQSTVDERILNLIKDASNSGYKCYAASDQDVMRSSYLKELIDLNSYFDKCFFSCDMGVTKTNIVFFENIINSLQCSSRDIYFWDDNPKNVETARLLGINAQIYSSFNEFFSSFSNDLSLE